VEEDEQRRLGLFYWPGLIRERLPLPASAICHRQLKGGDLVPVSAAHADVPGDRAPYQ
jgi:hypothetical protein